MNIGIDIDGVLTNMEESIIEYGTKFCYVNKIEYSINPNKYYENEMLMISSEDVEKFWNEYLAKYATEKKPREFAAEVISKLKENNKIFIITARNEEGLPQNLYGTMKKMVKLWLENNNIQYDELIFSGEDKLKICETKNIDIMIEDSPKNINNISSKIEVLCYNCQYNSNVCGNNITRVYSWYDILSKVEKISNKNNVTI